MDGGTKVKTPIKKPLAKGLVQPTNNRNLKSILKQMVVKLACYGVIPTALADWIIQAWRLSHE
jgi:hypothetical protein